MREVCFNFQLVNLYHLIQYSDLAIFVLAVALELKFVSFVDNNMSSFSKVLVTEIEFCRLVV